MIGHEDTKARRRENWLRAFVTSWQILVLASPAVAQTRLAVVQAEDRRAKTPNDLATLRAGARNPDEQIRRAAIRALGRLERPALIPDIVPALRNPFAGIRAEAANAVGQAAVGWKPPRSAPNQRAFDAAVSALTSRLKIETEPEVRAAIDETIGRLPYASAADVEAAERTLLDAAARADSIVDRLGVAKGFEALVRSTLKTRGPGIDAIAELTKLAAPRTGEASSGARIRRLAIETLSGGHAATEELLAAAAQDADAQVRRLAVREAGGPPSTPPSELSGRRAAILAGGLSDPSPMVRIEAMRFAACDAAAARAASDADAQAGLAALDRLARCAESSAAVAELQGTVDDLTDVGSARGWHRAAHALVALASASPERAAAVLPRFSSSRTWQLRMY